MPRSNNPAVPEDAVLGEERKLATVLFADLVGSTALASGEAPERVRLRLERFYEGMADEVQGAGGTLEKFAGDAVMAVFGAPAALEDHAERALHAALAMQRRLGELFRGELALRVGVNTGEVVVGRAREGSSFVSGDAARAIRRRGGNPGRETDRLSRPWRLRARRAADCGGQGQAGGNSRSTARTRPHAPAPARGERAPSCFRRAGTGARAAPGRLSTGDRAAPAAAGHDRRRCRP